MGNWNIETVDGSEFELLNVSFYQKMNMPPGGGPFPFDDDSIDISIGSTQVKLNWKNLTQIKKTDDGFMFVTASQRICGHPQVNGNVLLSGINEGKTMRVNINEIISASTDIAYDVEISWEQKDMELICLAKACDSNGKVIEKVSISSKFETAIDYKHKYGQSLKTEIEKLAQEELKILLLNKPNLE